MLHVGGLQFVQHQEQRHNDLFERSVLCEALDQQGAGLACRGVDDLGEGLGADLQLPIVEGDSGHQGVLVGVA